MQRTARERMAVWAERGEQARKHGYTKPLPPFEILDHTDLFERAWGWDTILPYHSSYPLTLYKKYLMDYYLHNTAAGNSNNLHGDRNGSGLASLADSCIKMESHLKHQWESRAKEFSDEIEVSLLSDKIVNCARQMTNVMESEFPAAAIALKCITKEAELMVEWLIAGTSVAAAYIVVSNKIRQCALSFMTSKHPEYVAPAAAMMGITKEAKLMCELLRKKCKSDRGDDLMNDLIRDRTLTAMLSICQERSAAEEPTGDNAAEKVISGESDVKFCSEEPVKNVILEAGKENQNTKIEDMLEIPFSALGGKADHEADGKGSKSAGKHKKKWNWKACVIGLKRGRVKTAAS
ncbi:unnamed protein product [Urochloa decumbens]|uniref:Uncharacterized protein n=1 Tax=Urochloa decumbens TaxID=240449 RepID=A0ABC8XB42_9POAL